MHGPKLYSKDILLPTCTPVQTSRDAQTDALTLLDHHVNITCRSLFLLTTNTAAQNQARGSPASCHRTEKNLPLVVIH